MVGVDSQGPVLREPQVAAMPAALPSRPRGGLVGLGLGQRAEGGSGGRASRGRAWRAPGGGGGHGPGPGAAGLGQERGRTLQPAEGPPEDTVSVRGEGRAACRRREPCLVRALPS